MINNLLAASGFNNTMNAVVNGGGTILVLREEGIGTVGLLSADRAFRVG